MKDRRTIFEIHRLKDLDFSNRQIAVQLKIDRQTVRKYLERPEYQPTRRKKKASKLDPFRSQIKELLANYPDVSGTVIYRRIQEKGFDGEITIVKNYLRELRGKTRHRGPFIRFESDPGQQMQLDWGHFKSLTYGDTQRKLYALVVIEGYSRMLYVYFAHSQKQATLHRGLLEAFRYLGGTPKELLVDNMLTAVVERAGPIVRFNEAFLDFLRPLRITPVACNPGAPNEKGKVEAGVKYVRRNFWPLRRFGDLEDVQRQALNWLETVANVRRHQSTGKRPVDSLESGHLRKLPDILPDCREVETLKVHSDFGIRFDRNVYTVPPWAIGSKVTLKADNHTVSVYKKDRLIATHPRNWERHKRIELPAHREQVRKLRKKVCQNNNVSNFLSMGQVAADYLEAICDTNRPVQKTVSHLLSLKDRYGIQALVYAINKALTRKLYDVAYIENILYQEMTPETDHSPVVLKKDTLNQIRLPSPCLEDYDAYAAKRKKRND